MALPTLWHYTCEHGYAGIGDAGELVPAYLLSLRIPPAMWWGRLVWLTDLSVPDREGLGLTMNTPGICDRTIYRYRVTDAAACVAWTRVRRQFHGEALERAPGARPRHWYVSAEPVPVVLDLR